MIYHYSKLTKEYTGCSEEKYDPLDNKPLIPGFSTQIEPPENKEGFAIIFIDEGWEYIEDHRGKTVYNKQNKLEKIVDYLGPISNAYTELEPSFYEEEWDGEKWTLSLESAKVLKHQEIEEKFKDKVEKGEFISEGLKIKVGCRIPSHLNDLNSISILIEDMENNGENFTDFSGSDESVKVSIGDLKNLRKEMISRIREIYDKKSDLSILIDSSTTIEEVNDIDWENS